MQSAHLVIITHGEDVGGILSAAILLRLLDPRKFTLCPISYNSQKTCMRDIAKSELIEDTLVYVLDLVASNHLFECHGEDNTPIIHLLVSRAKKVVWIDHHENTLVRKMDLKRASIEVVHHKDKCTADIVNGLFNTEIADYPARLASISRESDSRECRRPADKQIGQDLQKLISLHNFGNHLDLLGSLIRYISVYPGWIIKDRLDHPYFNIVIREYDEKYQTLFEDLNKSLVPVVVNGAVFLVGYADGFISSKDTIRRVLEQDQKNATAALIFFGPPVNNALFFKQTNSRFDAAAFCKTEGGDGRNGSGEFSPQFIVHKESFPEAVRQFKKKMNAFLK